MSIDLKTLTDLISFVKEAAELLKKTEGGGLKLYKKALRILKKLGVKL